MFIIILIITAVFVGIVSLCAKRVTSCLVQNSYDAALAAEKRYKILVNEKGKIFDEKLKLETDTVETFTLYEITKEITKSFSEENAIEIFKQRLYQHISYHEVHFVDVNSEDAKEYKKSDDYLVHILKGKRKNIGMIAIKGLADHDKEKFTILANQFALTLRRIRLYQEIERVAITDGLTNAHTRRYTLDRFQEEFQRSKAKKIKLSFLMIDVDHFKNFNDTYGHLTGDQILREIAGIIQDNVREIDIAGRFGGEEFCVVLPDTDEEGARYAAERIRQAAESKVIKAYDTTVKATVSVGIATYPFHGKSVDELIDKADWALYRAKKQGRNRVCSFGVYDDQKES